MVSYARLWETMKKKGVSQYCLITKYKVSAGQIGRLKKNMNVSTHTLEFLCNILQCPIEDVVEITLEPWEEFSGKRHAAAVKEGQTAE